MSASTLFSPLSIRGMTAKNRVAMSPMLMYMAGDDGRVTELHLAHYGARMIGGVGTVVTEVVAVAPEGRISTSDLGLWEDAQIAGMRRLADLAAATDTRFGVQLAHAGRKSTSQERGFAPSPIAYGDFAPPAELTQPELHGIIDAYRAAARRAVEAGVDLIEIHAGHGYLIHTFLSSRSNRRGDDFGGELVGRMRLLLEIVAAVRDELGAERPLFVRFPASDVLEGGISQQEGREIAAALVEAGVDLLDVSTGNLEPGYGGRVFPGYQAPYAAALRDLDTRIAVFGSITSPDLAEYIVSSGTADLVLLGRELLRNPFWAMQAAKAIGSDADMPIPTYARATGPYERGF